MTQVLKRTGTVYYTNSEWTTFKELVQGKDFVVKETTKHIRMDFDMKRKPDRDSFHTSTVIIESEAYEIAISLLFHSELSLSLRNIASVRLPCLVLERWMIGICFGSRLMLKAPM